MAFSSRSGPVARPQLHHAQVVVRAAHARVLVQRRAQLGARALVLAGVAVGAADEDVGLRDRPGATTRANSRSAASSPLQPEVLGGDQERQLRVVGRGRGLASSSFSAAGSSCPAAASARASSGGSPVRGDLSREPRQVSAASGLAHLELRGARARSAGGRSTRKRAALRSASFASGSRRSSSLQRRHQQPTLEQGLAVVALGGRRSPFGRRPSAAAMAAREGPRVRFGLGGGPRSEGAQEEAEE